MKRRNNNTYRAYTSEYPRVCQAGMANTLLSSEISWMATYAPHLDFSLALKRAEADASSIRCSKNHEVGE